MPYHPKSDRYDTMVYRRCGHSGLKLPAISLGLWHNFGGVDDFNASRELLTTAFDHGVAHFDLANNYGPPPGSAEETFGKILHQELSRYRDELIVSTKAGYTMWDGPYGDWGSRKHLIASLDQSLTRMRLDYVDIFYSHRYDPDTPVEETMEALCQAVQQGKALYVGISNYPPEQTRLAVKILASRGIHCLIHQVKYSMFVRTPEAGLFDALRETGVGCIVFSPLAQGLLTDRYLHSVPFDSRAAKPHGFLKKEQITSEILEKINALNRIALRRNQKLAQMALAWAMREKVVTSVLIGASRIEQLEQNIGMLNCSGFDGHELHEIEAILKS